MTEEKNSDLLHKIYEIERENNELLKKVRVFQKRSLMSKLIYWLLVALVLFGGYYYIRPFLQKINLVKQQGGEKVDEFINNLPQVKSIEKSLNNLESKYQNQAPQ